MKNQNKWSLDLAHSEIAFKVKHLMIANVKGKFKVFDANIQTTDKDFTTAEIDVWIDASSITTGDVTRDEHLIAVDFFDVHHHKQITFVSSTIGKLDKDGNSELWGELTMVGITKNIKLKAHFGGIVMDPWGNEKAGFTVTGKINRSEWGLKWNTVMEQTGLMLSDEVIIQCEVELTNTTQAENRMVMEEERTIENSDINKNKTNKLYAGSNTDISNHSNELIKPEKY